MLIERPYVPKGTHPIETGRYLIPTNMIYNLYSEVEKWISNRTPGAIFYGRPRLGKTKAIEYIKKVLSVDYETLPVFHICSIESPTISEDNFFAHFLQEVGHNLYSSGKSYVKRDRLIKFLVSQGEMSHHKRVVLFIDDAQRLKEKQYEWLMDMYNQLDKHGVSMSAILVGQTELMYQKSAFIQARMHQIIGRFMVHEYRFTGAKDVNDIRNCLIGYDSDSEYPIGSQWSFTKYYFPEAFEQGLRLESFADELYQLFTEIRYEYKITKHTDIPMLYLTLTIEYALKTYGSNGYNVEWPTISQWKEAIEYSGFIQAEKMQDVI